MKPLFILIGTFIISALVLKLINKQADFQLAARIAMSAMFIFTAIGHFVFTKGMAAMVPEFIPYKQLAVHLSGVFEVLIAVGLLLPNFKTITAWIAIVFLVLILPANIKAAIDNLNYQTGEYDGHGLNYLWLRIPMQVLFIGWIYFCAIKK